MHVPFCYFSQFCSLCKNVLTLLHVFVVFVTGSQRSAKVISPTCSSIDRDLLLGMHVPVGNHLEFVDICKDKITLFKVVLFLLFGSRRAGEEVPCSSKRITLDWLLRIEIPSSDFLKFLSLS